MGQNKSHAVMQQRTEPHDSLDFFPTPPWATRALCEMIGDGDLNHQNCWEPACGAGHMARPLSEYFGQVIASDVHSYGWGSVDDFLLPSERRNYDWIITNPPFRLAAQFIMKARRHAVNGIAMLVRSAFLEGCERHATIFSGDNRPTRVLQFVERVPMTKGRCLRSSTTATSYCWLVWEGSADHVRLEWIPPCRKRLERWGDYDVEQRPAA